MVVAETHESFDGFLARETATIMTSISREKPRVTEIE